MRAYDEDCWNIPALALRLPKHYHPLTSKSMGAWFARFYVNKDFENVAKGTLAAQTKDGNLHVVAGNHSAFFSRITLDLSIFT